MAKSNVGYIDQASGVIRLRVVTPSTPDQIYFARKVQDPLPPGDSPKIIVCKPDGTPRAPVTYSDGSVVTPYIGGHLEGFSEVWETHFA